MIARADDCARIITVKQTTVVIVSAHAADRVLTADRACAVTVFYCTVFCAAYAADILIAAEIGINNAHIGNLTACA